MTAVHYFAEEVSQILPGNFRTSLEIVVQHAHADIQVADVERIDFVPALGAELAPLRHYSVEVAESEENDLKFRLLAAHLQRLLCKVVEGLVQVCLHTSRRLVCNLNRRLQNSL